MSKELAQKEFAVIRDLLLVPFKQDLSNEELPERRRWKGECLLFQLPDLVPVNPNPDLGEFGFCKKDDDGNLLVTVRNEGGVEAPASTTRVTNLLTEAYFDRPTPIIPAGGSVDVKFEFQQDFPSEFRILVNAGNKIDESDLTNNTANGQCSTGLL